MWFSILSAVWRSRFGQWPARRQPVSARLAVEALEDRSVPAFLAPISSPGGDVQLAVGDFNHDGRADVAAIGGTIVSSSPTQFHFWEQGGAIVDGTLDVVVISGNVSVSLSNGDGTFQKPATLGGAKGYYLTGFGTSDVNGDGHLDVVAHTFDKMPDKDRWVGGIDASMRPYYGTAHDNVWLGKGDGTFSKVGIVSHPHTPWYWGWSSSWPPFLANVRATIADFNHDGFNDLATVDGSTSVVSVSLRNSDGAYQSAQTYAAGPNPGYVAAGDFNGDGWADLVVVNSLQSAKPTLSVLLNDGNW